MLLFIVCATCAAFYTWSVVKIYLAQRLADHSDEPSLLRAIALAPQNADYHNLLCRRMIFVSEEPQRALSECKKASTLNPYNSSIWLDLAQAYYFTGDRQLSIAVTQKALAVDPTTPDTLWSVANFFLIQGNASEAMKQFAIVLREEPSLAPAVLNICWQSLHDTNRIQSILPPNPQIYMAFIKLLLSTGDVNSASHIWSSLMLSKLALDYRQGLFYIDSLLQNHEVTQASEAWKQLALRSKTLQAYFQPDNLIMDGSFSQEILNSGFDWRYSPKPQISVTLDRAEFHTADRSLKLVYNGGGGDAGIFQYIAVQPGTRYRLSAWVRSEDLEAANGPVLAVVDSDNNETYSSTEETIGTTTWHRVETVLQTGPETRLLILAVLRRPGETHIQGNFWIDDIKLEALPPGETAQ